MKDLYAFYGSFRMGMSNHDLYKDSIQFIQTNTAKGFELYSLGEYPYAIKSEDMNQIMVVEIYKITNKIVQSAIHVLEINAGYYRDKVNLEGLEAYIYLFKKRGNEIRVKSGDWVQFFRDNSK